MPKKNANKRSGKQLMKELPIAHLTAPRRRDLLLELVECFREGHEASARANEIYHDAVTTFDKYDVDVQADPDASVSQHLGEGS